MEKRPYLLFFDLTKCLNPAILTLGCLTPQVCVEKCPGTITIQKTTFDHSFMIFFLPLDKAYSGYTEAMSTSNIPGSQAVVKAKMKPHCAVISNAQWNSMTPVQLIKEDFCPSWVLPSRPILGRCMPIGAGEAGSVDQVPA